MIVLLLLAGVAVKPGFAQTGPLGTSAVSPAPVIERVPDELGPMEAMPGMEVEWPDLSVAEPATDPMPISAEAEVGGEPTTQAAVMEQPQPLPPVINELPQSGEASRYTVQIDGMEGVEAPGLNERFRLLSLLRQGEGEPANVAQIDRRAREDAAMLRTLLRSYGYYAAEVEPDIIAATTPTGRLTVQMLVQPGVQYRLTKVDVLGLDETDPKMLSMQRSVGLKVGDAVDANRLETGMDALRAALGRSGYVFAEVGDPDVEIDHADQTGTLLITVDSGGKRRFGKIVPAGGKLFSARHIGRISRFKQGDVYDVADIEDLRRALIATGLVSTVEISPLRTANDEEVDIEVRLEPAPMRTIAAELGYGTGEGARAAVSWQHRNLLPPEGAVTFRGVAGTQEQSLSALLRRGNFRKRDRVLTGQISASHVDRAAYSAKTALLAAGIERQTNIVWQKKWTWSFGAEFLATDETDRIASTGMSRNRTFVIGSIPLAAAYDGSNDLLDPTRGFRLSARIAPELSLQGKAFGYVRTQLDGSAYVPVSDRAVIAGRLRFGTISGAKRDSIAPSRRFYAGGGGSIRGFGYQQIGPRDVFDDPIGGRSLTEFALEARVRFGNFGIVPFIDGGNLYTSALPTFKDLRFGAGLGVRYHSSFGPIRVDVGTPIGRRTGENRIGVYVSLGQAF